MHVMHGAMQFFTTYLPYLIMFMFYPHSLIVFDGRARGNSISWFCERRFALLRRKLYFK